MSHAATGVSAGELHRSASTDHMSIKRGVTGNRGYLEENMYAKYINSGENASRQLPNDRGVETFLGDSFSLGLFDLAALT